MKKRRALLIGVPEYESEAIEDLPIVRKDLENLHVVLEQSGYSVRTIGTNDILQTSRSKILQALRQECRNSKGVDTLLLYFSGHGIHYQGQDYLIPSDSVLDDPDFIEDYLVSTDLGTVLDLSKAKTILFFIDACREGVKLDVKGTYLANWSRGERRNAAQRSCIIIFSCGPGQVSQFIPGDEGCSLFTKALAEVLAPEHPACTLEDVLRSTQDVLDNLVARYGKRPHELRHSFEGSIKNDILSRVVCDSTLSETEDDLRIDPWTSAAEQSPLWNDDLVANNTSTTQLKQKALEIIAACWQQWEQASRQLSRDPWKDRELPIRVLESLDLLILRSDPQVKLTSAETAILVTVPFVREACLASGIIEAAKVNPFSLEGYNEDVDFIYSWNKIQRELPRFQRKAELLHEQGLINEREAVLSWMLYQSLFKVIKLWQPSSSGGYLPDIFVDKSERTRHCNSLLPQEALSQKRLIELARCIFADLERIDRDDRPEGLKANISVGRYSEEEDIKEKMLAYLLNLAGALAIDVRALPDLLVDHIGLSDPLTAQQIFNVITKARWNPAAGRSRVLKVICNHPAIDLALRQHVEHANSILTHIRRQVNEKRQEMEALSGLPTCLLPDGIKPELQNNLPAYQTPHINFQLAHDEIRELLMGEQLYGDPMLAIRELYQNALDACRYKAARLEYLQQTGQYEGLVSDWNGLIIFRQGSENGRAYLECEDNGIGMGIQHLYKCFARAGRRFADLPEFIEEQSEWLKCDPPVHLYPNSRFGVGVLSYFMLADELEIETSRLDRKGSPGPRVYVRIPGSSGLFRFSEGKSDSSSGTKIRLYLNRTHHKGQLISCIETLRKLLWVTDFRTEIHQFGRYEVWEPGELKHPNYPNNYCIKINGSDIWWVPESEYYYIDKGGILSDGIWAGESQPGFVTNLSRQQRPKLTVNREEIVEWDRAWVRDALIENLEPLIKWPHLDFKWLWKLSYKHPQVSARLVDLLVSRKANLKLGGWGLGDVEVSVEDVGCLEIDTWLSYFRYGIILSVFLNFYPWWLLPYRMILWSKYGLRRLSKSFQDSCFYLMNPADFPIPTAGDGVALLEDLDNRNSRNCVQDYIPPAHLVLASKKLDEKIIDTVKRFQKYLPLGLTMPEINVESIGDMVVTEEDCIALSRKVEEIKKKPAYKPWIEDEISAAHIVLTSARLNDSLADTVNRLRKFSSIGLIMPSIDFEALNKIKITQEDITILSEGLNGEIPLFSNRISPAQIVFSAKRLNESIVEAVKRFEKYLPLGLQLPSNLNLKPFTDFDIKQEDLILLCEEFNGELEGEVAWPFNRLPVSQIIRVSRQLNQSVKSTLERLQKFVPLGLELPECPLVNDLDDLMITREDLILFSSRYSQITRYTKHIARTIWSDDLVRGIHLISGSNRLSESISDTIQRFQKFTPIGLKISPLDVDLLEDFVQDKNNIIAFSRRCTQYLDGPEDILQGDIHPTRIILVAMILDESIDVTFERFKRFASILDLNLPGEEVEDWNLSFSV